MIALTRDWVSGRQATSFLIHVHVVLIDVFLFTDSLRPFPPDLSALPIFAGCAVPLDAIFRPVHWVLDCGTATRQPGWARLRPVDFVLGPIPLRHFVFVWLAYYHRPILQPQTAKN